VIDDIVIIILSNLGFGSVGPMGKKIAAILYNQPYDKPKNHKEISVNRDFFKKYVGSYQKDKALLQHIFTHTLFQVVVSNDQIYKFYFLFEYRS
jgi:hypothetical protein